MVKSKKQMFIIIGVFVLTLLLGTTTYAFFNYTRTGSNNTIRVGRINFSSNQNNSLNITNLFPMTSSEAENTNLDTLTITIDGDTTYSEGEEFLVSIVDVNNTVNNKKIPVNYIASYIPQENKTIGTSSNNYFNERENEDKYLLTSEGIVYEDERILIGHITNGDEGVHGILTIKAYIDKNRIAISDTYPNEEIISLNPNMTQTDINNCISYITEIGYDRYLLSGENLESFCDGTGTLDGENMEEWIEDGWFDDDELNNLINIKILNYKNNGTTDEWVNNRTVFTTEEWNSLTTNSINFKIKVEANEGIWVKDNINVMNTIEYPRNTGVKEIHFIRESTLRMQQRYEAAEGIKNDLTYNDEGKVLAWQEEDILYIASNGETYLTTGAGFFNGFYTIETVVFDNINTSRVTSMNGMFAGNIKLKNVDLRSFDTSNVTDMTTMFSGCTDLERVNMSGLGSNLLTNTSSMFGGCNNLEEIDMSNFNFGTSSMGGQFYNLTSLEIINLTNADTSQVTFMNGLFNGCTSLTKINLSGLGNDNLESIVGLIQGCTSLKEIDMSNFNFGKVSNIDFLFMQANTNVIEKINLNNAKTTNFTSLGYTFDGLTALKEVDLTDINTSKVTTIQATFRNCQSLTTLDLSSFDTSLVTNVNSTFQNCSNLNTIYVSNSWNISDDITYSANFFWNCTSLVGGNGTHYDGSKTDKSMAVIDNNDHEGYLTLKTS